MMSILLIDTTGDHLVLYFRETIGIDIMFRTLYDVDRLICLEMIRSEAFANEGKISSDIGRVS